MAIIDHIPSRKIALGHKVASPSLFQRLSIWRSRRALAHLDARALKDIGLTREAADREAKKMIWDVPANWKNI